MQHYIFKWIIGVFILVITIATAVIKPDIISQTIRGLVDVLVDGVF